MANGDTSNQAWYAGLTRPVFVGTGIVILLTNYALPAIVMLFGKEVAQADIPAEVIYMIGASFLGYGWYRTKEKISNGK